MSADRSGTDQPAGEAHSGDFLRLIEKRKRLVALTHEIDSAIWDDPPVSPPVKERARIAGARALDSGFCTSFRVTRDGRHVLDDPADEARATLAERCASDLVLSRDLAPLLPELRATFTEEELADLLFSIGYFTGMTLLAKALHFGSDDS